MSVENDYTSIRLRGRASVLQNCGRQNSNQKVDHRYLNQDSRASGDSGDGSDRATGSQWSRVNTIVGFGFMLLLGFLHAFHMRTLHENNLWFSNIQEVEREISFRTESGLYYSYYKQMVMAPSLLQGIRSLIHDNITEHPDEINVLARMNIYQEVMLAILYRSVPGLQAWLTPIFFYINTVFALHIILIFALYSMTWMLSGTWLSGALTVLFYIVNKADTTRVDTYIPLRESFALPFLWIQLAGITFYFGKNKSEKMLHLSKNIILLSTFLFAVTWQFNQFALLLQSMSLFAVQLLRLVDHDKIVFVYLAQGSAMLAVCVMQFFNPMILSGLLLSFIASSLVIMWIQSHENFNDGRFLWKLSRLIFYILLVFLLTAIFNKMVKLIIQQEADEHINKFVLAKFGFETSRDFDVRLYLCNGAFEFLTVDFFERLFSNIVFPFYLLTHIVLLILLAVAAFKILRTGNGNLFSDHPELAYHTVQIVFFGAVAVMAVRMKYFWTPYMCILASLGISDYRAWNWLLSKWRLPSKTVVNITRNAAVLLIGVILMLRALPNLLKEVEALMEFYDPDTVELMKWINSDTALSASFTGSMQLLAGVKLCTGRPITNHPHYEDKHLRQKTKELYQIYGRRLPEDVYEILQKYSTNYIILEDSICLAPSKNGCRLPDLIDVSNGIMPDTGSSDDGLIQSDVPRFCNEIRFARKNYLKYFKLVFENKTFRVYAVL